MSALKHSLILIIFVNGFYWDNFKLAYKKGEITTKLNLTKQYLFKPGNLFKAQQKQSSKQQKSAFNKKPRERHFKTTQIKARADTLCIDAERTTHTRLWVYIDQSLRGVKES